MKYVLCIVLGVLSREIYTLANTYPYYYRVNELKYMVMSLF